MASIFEADAALEKAGWARKKKTAHYRHPDHPGHVIRSGNSDAADYEHKDEKGRVLSGGLNKELPGHLSRFHSGAGRKRSGQDDYILGQAQHRGGHAGIGK